MKTGNGEKPHPFKTKRDAPPATAQTHNSVMNFTGEMVTGYDSILIQNFRRS